LQWARARGPRVDTLDNGWQVAQLELEPLAAPAAKRGGRVDGERGARRGLVASCPFARAPKSARW